MTRIIRSLLISSAVLAFGWVMPEAAQAATVYFSPDPVTVGQGETSEVQVRVSTDVAIYSVDITVSYPTNLVTADSASTEGTDFPFPLKPSP